MSVNLITGNVLDVLKTLDSGSVHCVITSPPYWGLRAYGTESQVWLNGDEACQDGQHDWVEHTQPPKGGKNLPDNMPRTGGNTQQQLDDDSPRFGVKSNFCARCGAWRGELGLEPTPELYVAHLVLVFREVWRVLRDDGTLWLNLGDTYVGGKGQSGSGGSEYQAKRRARGVSLNTAAQTLGGAGMTRPSDNRALLAQGNLKPKDLVGIPWRVAFALQADGWWLRQDIIWHKPNPMPESVRDRCTKSHEYIFLLTKSLRYYYDQQAILEPANYDGRKDTMFKGAVKYKNGFAPSDTKPQTMSMRGHERWSRRIEQAERKMDGTGYGGDGSRLRRHNGYFDQDGNLLCNQFEDGQPARNKRSVWTVPTSPFKGAHFAVFPPKLVEPMILAGTSERGVCPLCKAPWERITDHEPIEQERRERGSRWYDLQDGVRTIGWQPTCDCAAIQQDINPVPATVLDPFCGSGTTGVVAVRHGRNFVGVDMNAEYIEIARARIAEAQAQLRLLP